MERSCWITALLLLSFTCEGLAIDPIVLCLEPGNGPYETVNSTECDQSSEWQLTAGLLPNGTCARCGFWPDVGVEKLECPQTTTVVRYVNGNKRYCGCNIGYYGDQSAAGCTPCPAGTTTTAYGGLTAADCNVCAVGYTGTAPGSCKPCSQLYSGPVTTAKAGNGEACVCPKGYVGQPGNCKPCVGYNVTTAFPGSQQCVCPAGGTPPFCIPCTEGVIVNDKCVCPAGLTGVWPKCSWCPNSIGYETTTFGPGNNNQCGCRITSDDDDFVNLGISLNRDPTTGACQCKNTVGSYLKVVPNYRFSLEYSEGPCDKLYEDTSRKVIQLNGESRLGCDSSNRYGASLAMQVFTEGEGGNICIKCNDTGAYIDPVTTKCLCKPGYGVNPFYGPAKSGSNASAPFNGGYCIPCNSPSVTLGTFPELLPGKDTFCRCNWAKGYAGMRTQGRCYKCPGPNMVVNQTTGTCDCAKGYFPQGQIYNGDIPKKCVPASSCKPGYVVGYDSCVCNQFKTSTGACVFPKPGCEKVKVTFWANVASPNGTFPSSVRKAKATKVVQLTPAQLNSTANLMALVPAASRQKLAVALNGCFCSRTSATTVLELTSIGSASLQTTETREAYSDTISTAVAIDQSAPHTTPVSSYYGVQHDVFFLADRCVPFQLTFYSSSPTGLLKLRSVQFPYTPR